MYVRVLGPLHSSPSYSRASRPSSLVPAAVVSFSPPVAVFARLLHNQLKQYETAPLIKNRGCRYCCARIVFFIFYEDQGYLLAVSPLVLVARSVLIFHSFFLSLSPFERRLEADRRSLTSWAKGHNAPQPGQISSPSNRWFLG